MKYIIFVLSITFLFCKCTANKSVYNPNCIISKIHTVLKTSDTIWSARVQFREMGIKENRISAIKVTMTDKYLSPKDSIISVEEFMEVRYKYMRYRIYVKKQ
jgi:hypothetical protein